MKQREQGKVWSGQWFHMQQNPRMLLFNPSGYWSYPAFIPDGKGGVLWLHLVVDTHTIKGRHCIRLRRPRAMALTPPTSCQLVEYRDFRYGDDPLEGVPWDEDLDLYPWRWLRRLSDKELHDYESVLMLTYEAAGRQFAEHGTLSSEFAIGFLILNHPFFRRFLKILTPDSERALSTHWPRASTYWPIAADPENGRRAMP